MVRREPISEVATPVFAQLQYPDGYQVYVGADRLQVSRASAPGGADTLAQRIMLTLIGLWPLVEPTAIGLNWMLDRQYASEVERAQLKDRLLQPNLYRDALGADAATGLTLAFAHRAARVTLKLGFDEQTEGAATFVVDANVHFTDARNVRHLVESQGEWYTAVDGWIERLRG